jgi:hypothetical protein
MSHRLELSHLNWYHALLFCVHCIITLQKYLYHEQIFNLGMFVSCLWYTSPVCFAVFYLQNRLTVLSTHYRPTWQIYVKNSTDNELRFDHLWEEFILLIDIQICRNMNRKSTDKICTIICTWYIVFICNDGFLVRKCVKNILEGGVECRPTTRAVCRGRSSWNEHCIYDVLQS